MNRYVIAVAVAVFSSSALALEVGPPFEQTQLDRELPDIQFAPVKPYVADSRAPYEQAQIDRQLPDLGRRFEMQRQVTDGSSVSDVKRTAQP